MAASACDVMISYRVSETGARGDGSVFALKAALMQRGFSVFVGESASEGGDNWPSMIERGVEQCKAFVVLCSETYGDESPWIARELALADNLRKPLIPVWHSGAYPPKAVAIYLAGTQRIPVGDYRDGYAAANIPHEQVADELAAALKRSGCSPSFTGGQAQAPAPAPSIDATLGGFLENCSLDAGQRGEVAAALRCIGVTSASDLDTCVEEDLQQLTLPPATVKVLRAGLETRKRKRANSMEAGRKDTAEALDAECQDHKDVALEAEAQAALSDKVQELLKLMEGKTELKLSRGVWGMGYGVGMGYAKVDALKVALTLNTTLTQLSVADNRIGDAGAIALAEALTVNAMLTKLDVSSNHIGDAGASALAEALTSNATLTKLDVSSNHIGKAGAGALAEALTSNATLTKPDVSSSQIGNSGASALAEALKVNATLMELDLSNNDLGDAGVTALAEGLAVNATLMKLDVSRNHIGNSGASVLAEALKVNATLTELDVSDNDVGDAGMTALAEALKVNPTLMKLDVRNNHIGDAGAIALAEALKVNKVLPKLDVTGNHIGDAGAIALAEALKVNKVLTKLNVANNHIGVVGGTALAEALTVNATLTALCFWCNGFGDAVVTALAEALKVNATLTELRFFNTDVIGDAGASALVEALKENATLTELNVGRIGDAGASALAEALELNKTLKKQDASCNPSEEQAELVPDFLLPTCDVTLQPDQDAVLRVSCSAGGAELHIPAGAVTCTTRVCLAVRAVEERSIRTLGPFVALLPHGLQLQRAASLTVSLSQHDGAVMLYNPGNDSTARGWRKMDSAAIEFSDRSVTLAIDHFCYLTAAETETVADPAAAQPDAALPTTAQPAAAQPADIKPEAMQAMLTSATRELPSSVLRPCVPAPEPARASAQPEQAPQAAPTGSLAQSDQTLAHLAAAGSSGAADIVISYRVPETGSVSTGDSSVFHLRDALRQRHYTVFVGESDLIVGDQWPLVIQAAVEGCRAFIPLCSKTYGDSKNSKWSYRELVLADNLDKPLLPVWHSGKYPPHDVMIYLSGSQRAPAGDHGMSTTGLEVVVDQLVAALQLKGITPSR